MTATTLQERTLNTTTWVFESHTNYFNALDEINNICNKMGIPSNLSMEERIGELIIFMSDGEYVSNGNFRTVACETIGLEPSSEHQYCVATLMDIQGMTTMSVSDLITRF